MSNGLQADPLHVDWKQDFYGSNYDRLLSIKKKYDPDHVFYGRTTVGSDYWVEMTDQRLCRTNPNETTVSVFLSWYEFQTGFFSRLKDLQNGFRIF